MNLLNQTNKGISVNILLLSASVITTGARKTCSRVCLWYRKLVPFLVLILSVSKLHAQYNDAGLWLGMTIEKKITSSTSLVLSEELRMNENISQVGTVFTDLGLSHKLNKYFSAGLNYRFSLKRNPDAYYGTRHRLYGDITGRYKIKRVTIVLRERIQSQMENINSSETGRFPQWYLRSKLTVRYSLINKIKPSVAIEVFYQLNNPEGNEIDNLRYSAGIEYEFNKRHVIEPFYIIQQEIHVNNPVTDFVSGISYAFTF